MGLTSNLLRPKPFYIICCRHLKSRNEDLHPSVEAKDVERFEKGMHTALKLLTGGVPRDIVDTSHSAAEAWFRLTARFYGRNVHGATAIATRTASVSRSTC